MSSMKPLDWKARVQGLRVQIERDERAQHRGVQEEVREAELLHARLDRAERRVRGDGRDERREKNEPQADAVDGHVVANAEARHPVVHVEKVPAARRSTCFACR